MYGEAVGVRSQVGMYLCESVPVCFVERILLSLFVDKHRIVSAWKNGVVLSSSGETVLIRAAQHPSPRIVVAHNTSPDMSAEECHLRKTVDIAIESFSKDFYPSVAAQMQRLYACSHCVSSFLILEGSIVELVCDLVDPMCMEDLVYMFSLSDALKTEGKVLLCPLGNVKVDMVGVAPDIFLTTTKKFDGMIVKEKEVGRGAFATVYEGRLLVQDELVKQGAEEKKKERGGDEVGESKAIADLSKCAVKKKIAIKELHLSLGEGEGLTQLYIDFIHEVHILGKLDHPNILKFYGVLLTPLSMITELLPMKDLLQILNSRQEGVLKVDVKSVALADVVLKCVGETVTILRLIEVVAYALLFPISIVSTSVFL